MSAPHTRTKEAIGDTAKSTRLETCGSHARRHPLTPFTKLALSVFGCTTSMLLPPSVLRNWHVLCTRVVGRTGWLPPQGKAGEQLEEREAAQSIRNCPGVPPEQHLPCVGRCVCHCATKMFTRGHVFHHPRQLRDGGSRQGRPCLETQSELETV